jgi:predicted transcriptional regulator of viral defense system
VEDERPPELWTIDDVAAHLGIQPSSARRALSRMGIRAHSFRAHPASHRAQALYDPEQVKAAHAARPGRGTRTDLQEEETDE